MRYDVDVGTLERCRVARSRETRPLRLSDERADVPNETLDESW